MSDTFFSTAFRPSGKVTDSDSVRVYEEKPGVRTETIRAAREVLVDHYVGWETVLRAGGFGKAAEVIKNSLPRMKRIQSGDLGEILAVEFLHAETHYRVPILKLRYKSDRDTPLHGNDVIALDVTGKRPTVLKGECKSRAGFYPAHLMDAVAPLDAHGCCPNPSTLSFITKRLYEKGIDNLANLFRDFQSTKKLKLRDVEHLVFVLCQNNPAATLTVTPPPAKKIRRRWSVGTIITNHAEFVSSVFNSAHGT